MKALHQPIFFFLVLQLVNCNGNSPPKKDSSVNSHVESVAKILMIDTTITYDLDSVSVEGAEAVVKYEGGLIQLIDVSIYGETGQAQLTFVFSEDSVRVIELVYSYLKSIEQIDSEADMNLDHELNYILDRSGKVLAADEEQDESTNIYPLLKRQIPFELR